MKTLLYTLLLPVLLYSCTAAKTQDCGQVMCTQEFRQVNVSFKDQAGNPVAVTNFKAVIQRTGKETAPGDAMPGTTGSYRVASDSDVRSLTESGDTIIVTATNPKNNTQITETFVITGGACACHIAKKSGPEAIILK